MAGGLLVGEVFARLGLDDAPFSRGLDNSEGKAKRFGGVFQNAVGTGIGMMASNAATAGFNAIVGGFSSAISSGMDFNASMEQNQIAFSTMLGSGEAASAMLSDLADFAAKTPFELPDLTNGAKKLMAYGFAADEILPMLKTAGDAASGLGMSGAEGVDRIARSLGQMKAKGKVSAEEMMQLSEMGIGAWEFLAKSMGVSTAEAMDAVSKGAVSADQGIQAILDGMGTKFPNMMEKQSASFKGLLSTISDNANMVFGQVLSPLFDNLSKTVLPAVSEGLSRFQTTFAETGSYGAAFTSAFQPVLDKLKAAGVDFGAFGAGVKDFLAPIIAGFGPFKDAVVEAFGTWLTYAETVRAAVMPAFTTLFGTLKNLVAELLPTITAVIGYLTTGWNAISPVVVPIITALYTVIAAIVTALGEIIRAILAVIRGDWGTAWEAIKAAAAAIWNGIVALVSGVFEGIATFIGGIWDKIKAGATAAWEGIKAAISAPIIWLYNHNRYFKMLVDFVVNAFQDLKGKATAIWQGISSTIGGIIEGVKGTVQKVVDKIKELFLKPVTEAKSWGKNLIQSFIDGIKAMLSNLGSALGDVAQKIAAFLGFHSPTKEGPGQYADQWAPNFVSMFAKGLTDTMPQVQAAMNGLALNLNPAMAGGGTNNSRTYGATNIHLHGTSDELLSKLLRELERRGVKV